MKHTYTTTQYHPRKVSFEVTAMLRDEESDYSRHKARDFDPLLDEKAVEKYREYERERDLPYGHVVTKEEALAREEKRFRSWKAGVRLASVTVKEIFESTIQAMLVKSLVANRKLAQAHAQQPQLSHLEVKEVGKVLHAQGLQPLPQHSAYPHVEALQHQLRHEESARVRYW